MKKILLMLVCAVFAIQTAQAEETSQVATSKNENKVILTNAQRREALFKRVADQKKALEEKRQKIKEEEERRAQEEAERIAQEQAEEAALQAQTAIYGGKDEVVATESQPVVNAPKIEAESTEDLLKALQDLQKDMERLKEGQETLIKAE